MTAVPFAMLLLVALAGVMLLALKFPVREYFYDTAAQIGIGMQTRAAGFLVTHGQRSGAGIANPPLFAYIMGLLTALTTDPEILAATVTVANVAAIAAGACFFFLALPHPWGIVMVAVMATAQATVDYSVLLWEGSLLMPLAVAFQFLLWRLLTTGSPRAFIGLAGVAGLSAQCHQSGILLYPLLAVVAVSQRRRIGARALLAAIALVLVLSAPYLHYILREGGLGQVERFAESGNRKSLGTLLNINTGMTSTFFTYYPFYRIDLKDYLLRAAGPAAWALYLASLAVAIAFLVGWASYLWWALSRRRIFSRREEDQAAFPAPFQAAGFTLTALTLLYALSARYIWYKHFLVAFPAHALLASWTIWRLWGSRAARALFAVAIAAGVLVTAGIYREIARAGGTLANGTIHYYKLSYASYKQIREAVWGAVTPGHVPRLFFDGVSPTSLTTVVFPDRSHLGRPAEAVTLDVRWDADAARFVLGVVSSRDAVERHARSLRRVAEALPDGATIAGTEPKINVLNPAGDVLLLKGLLPAGSRWVRYLPKAAAAESDWIVIDTADPRLLAPAPGAWAWDLLIGGEFGLVSEDRGLYVFRRQGDLGPGRELLAKQGLPFREFLIHGKTGRVEIEPEAIFGFARRIRTGRDLPGVLLELPLPVLPSGSYEAVVRFRRAAVGARPALGVRIAVGAAGPALAEQEIAPSDLSQGNWEEAVLPFSVSGRVQAGAVLRVTTRGAGDVALDAPRLRIP